MVSPADGLVSDVMEIADCELVGGGPAVRIGIFLSVFNVHVNRAPVRRRGGLLSLTKKASLSTPCRTPVPLPTTESNTIVMLEPGTQEPVAGVKQIVGLIARRIICTAKVGDSLSRGQRFGMIKFGSRTELYIPKRLDPQVKVKKGDKVRGGLDIVATVNKTIEFGTISTATPTVAA